MENFLALKLAGAMRKAGAVELAAAVQETGSCLAGLANLAERVMELV